MCQSFHYKIDGKTNFKFTLKDGDKKFSINQNLTRLFVCFNTLRIIIDKNLSYRWPDATENILISALFCLETFFENLYLGKKKKQLKSPLEFP